MENVPRLIITVPHCKKDENIEFRHYDLRAAAAAQALERAARVLAPEIEIIVIYSDTIREDCDLNRDECLDRPWRQKLNNIIRKNDIHIDCHSYPNTMESFLMVGKRSSFDTEMIKKIKPPPVLFIYNKDNKMLIEDARELAAEANSAAAIIPPDSKEIIVSILRQSPADMKLLIEFNESEEVLSDKDLRVAAAGIIAFLIMKKNKESKLKIVAGGNYFNSNFLSLVIIAGLIVTILFIAATLLRDSEGRIFGWKVPNSVIIALGILFVLVPP